MNKKIFCVFLCIGLVFMSSCRKESGLNQEIDSENGNSGIYEETSELNGSLTDDKDSGKDHSVTEGDSAKKDVNAGKNGSEDSEREMAESINHSKANDDSGSDESETKRNSDNEKSYDSSSSGDSLDEQTSASSVESTEKVTENNKTSESSSKTAASESPSSSNKSASSSEKSSGKSEGSTSSSSLKKDASFVCTAGQKQSYIEGMLSECRFTVKNCMASGDKTASEIGTYTVYFTPSTGHAWADGTTTKKAVTWEIVRGGLEKPTASNTEFSAASLNYFFPSFNYNQSQISMSGATEPKCSAGNYSTVFSIKDKTHYMWTDGTDGDVVINWSVTYYTNITPEAIIAAINNDRVSNGLETVSADPVLMSYAATRAREISTNFSHDNFDATEGSYRAQYGYGYLSENILMTSLSNQTAETIEAAFMGSSGHRTNILTSLHNVCGVGVYQAADGTIYVVQIFSYDGPGGVIEIIDFGD